MNPRVRQLFVAASVYLAAISAGATTGYPTVLLQQFKANDSGFQIDTDTASWIGSIQGIAGIPSILMPTVMQLHGRKFAYFISCLILALGWIIIFLANNITTIIAGLFFLGLGSNSLLPVSYLTVSEIVEPNFRSISLLFIAVFICVGISTVHVLGRSFHWAHVTVIMFVPILISGTMCKFWVESPAWLAYRSKFEKCKTSFILLRGNNECAIKELRELMHLEKYPKVKNTKIRLKERLKNYWKSLLRRDCYLPCLHTVVILLQMYWGGNIVVYVYSAEMLEGTTNNQNAVSIGLAYIDVIIIVGSILCSILLKYFDSKHILLATGAGVTICLISTCLVRLFQSLGYISDDSLLGLCFLLGFITSSNIGISNLSFSFPAELMPVKHKSFGGALYIICCSLFHSSVLKAFPYMLGTFGLIGTFVCFSIVLTICMFYIWKYVPETRNKTLQGIEKSYNKNIDNFDTDELDTLTEQAHSIK